MRLEGFGEEGPETADKVHRLLERYPSLRFKLDPTNEWTEELVAELAATGAIDSVDLKGHYRGTPVDVDTDPELYRMVAEGLPDAWLEDPDLSVPEADAVLEPHRDRITWDAPIHSIADIEALPFTPKMVNIKPSRIGPLTSLLAAYDYCEQRGHRRLRRRPVRARRGPRPHPVPGGPVPPGHAERHRPAGVQHSRTRRTGCPRAPGRCRSPTPAFASAAS